MEVQLTPEWTATILEDGGMLVKSEAEEVTLPKESVTRLASIFKQIEEESAQCISLTSTVYQQVSTYATTQRVAGKLCYVYIKCMRKLKA